MTFTCTHVHVPIYTYEASLAREQKHMHMHSGHGYDGQLNYTICDTCRPFQSQFFTNFDRFVVFTSHSGSEISRSDDFFVDDNDNNNDNTDYVTPCTCMRDN